MVDEKKIEGDKEQSPQDQTPKTPGWAGLQGPEEVEELDEETLREMAETEVAWHLMWKSVASTLYLIYQELKRGNDYMISGPSTTIALKETPPEAPKTSPFKLKAPASPENLRSEGEIEKFYREQLSDVMTSDKLSGVEISVEENKVVLRLPWLDSGWAAINSRLTETMGGERIVDGKKTRYEFPRP